MTESTISALVVARNEDAMLEDCIRRLGWVNQIIVVVEGVTDKLRIIVDKYNGQIVNGSWKNQGFSPDAGIKLISSDWILEVDVDDWVPSELEEEIIETIKNPYSDFYSLKVDNYIGDKLITRGWGSSPLGRQSYYGLYKNGTKSFVLQRINLEEIFEQSKLKPGLKNAIISRKHKNISSMLLTLDFYTTLQAKNLANNGKINSLVGSFCKFLYRFIKVYFRRGSCKEGGYGFILALCAGLYPLVSNIKAVYEEGYQKKDNQRHHSF